MDIACIVLVGVLLLFVLTTFLLTFKNYKFDIEGGQLKVRNAGSHLKVFFNDELIVDRFSPRLINGEEIEFSLGEKKFLLKAKSNSLGNKLNIQIFEGDKKIADNGVELKNKNKDEKKA